MSKERRSYPRYTMEFSVKVVLPDNTAGKPGATFEAEATNLSRTSVQFNCKAGLVSALLQQQQLPYTCVLEFSLPMHKKVFTLPAQVVTHRRISQFDYVLVLLLKHEDMEQEELLDNMLHQQQQQIGLD